MNQQRYMEIRNSLDLRHDPQFLLRYGLQTIVLVAACVYIPLEFSNSPVRFVAIPLISLLMLRSFAFMHEAVHGLISKNRRLDNFLGVVSGTLCLLSYESWKQAHIEHHRWSGNLDKDPVMGMVKTFPNFPKPLRDILTLGWKCWVPTLSFLQHSVFWSITLKHLMKKQKTFTQILSVVLPVAFWVCLISLTPSEVILSLLLPAVILYLIVTEVINAPHHLNLPYFHGETKIPVWDQFKTARTCIYPSWMARFLVLNFNYHIEHHMYPYVPWYHLDKIHKALRPELKEDYNLDPMFSWIIKNRTKDLAAVWGSSQVSKCKDEAHAA